MIGCSTTENDIMNNWMQSGLTARIAGIDLLPTRHPMLKNSIQCVTKGQATVYFLSQSLQANTWILKKFTPAKKPTNEYLTSISDCLPGGLEFFSCLQRRFLTADHFDIRNSNYKNRGLTSYLEGTILMPKVPGMAWASFSDDLREGSQELSLEQRYRICLNLAKCVLLLEANQCSHRDLSANNVFVDSNCNVYLIDWDCLFHPRLPFQPNTAVGTSGYIAPIVKTNSGVDSSVSWCEKSDRFALSILIAEFILTNIHTPPAYEDGTLFSQDHIFQRDHEFIKEQLNWLRFNSAPCGELFEKALFAESFEQCPSPADWISALKYNLRQHDSNIIKPKGNQYIQVVCNDCKKTFGMSKVKYDRLKAENKSILCKECFQLKLDKWSVERTQQNLLRPEVVCEHCQKTFRITRKKLDILRQRAKPVLCSNCLTKQLERWEGEKAAFESSHLKIKCKLCSETFLVSKDKRELLLSEGKDIFCRKCFESKINSNWRT